MYLICDIVDVECTYMPKPARAKTMQIYIKADKIRLIIFSEFIFRDGTFLGMINIYSVIASRSWFYLVKVNIIRCEYFWLLFRLWEFHFRFLEYRSRKSESESFSWILAYKKGKYQSQNHCWNVNWLFFFKLHLAHTFK